MIQSPGFVPDLCAPLADCLRSQTIGGFVSLNCLVRKRKESEKAPLGEGGAGEVAQPVTSEWFQVRGALGMTRARRFNS